MQAWFAGSELEAFTAFWRVFDEHHEGIAAAAQAESTRLAPAMSDPAKLTRVQERLPDLIALVWRAARDGDWTQIASHMETSGAQLAKFGLSLDAGSTWCSWSSVTRCRGW